MVADRIREYIQTELIVDPTQRVDLDTPLLDGLLDSQDLLGIVAFLEESFGVTVEPAAIVPEHFATIRDVERFVQAELSRES